MIQATTPNTLWYPGKKLEGFGTAQLSARAREIAKNREELLGLLRDLPESEYELSFSDLVEKSTPSVDDAASIAKDGDLAADKEAKKVVTGIKERKKLRRNSSSGFGGSSNGVLLNFYMPSSLQRSLMVSRAGRATTAQSPKVGVVDCDKREKEPVMFGCLSGLWERRREKSTKKVAERKRREAKTCHLVPSWTPITN